MEVFFALKTDRTISVSRLAGAALLVLAIVCPGMGHASDTVLTVPTDRPGVTQPLLLIEPAEPTAIVALLFVGSDGIAGFTSRPSGWRGRNFLFRSADAFVRRGVAAAILERPSDQETLWNHRTSADHTADIGAVIAALRGKGYSQVWLIGTSMGTVSAANAAARLPVTDIAGLVLTSSVVYSSRSSSETITDVPLERIALPVLIVRHVNDGCKVSPPSGADIILERLRSAPVKRLMEFNGGSFSETGPCEGLSPHGYIGIEDVVVDAIVGWMQNPEAQ